jgi:hypothetical protein
MVASQSKGDSLVTVNVSVCCLKFLVLITVTLVIDVLETGLGVTVLVGVVKTVVKTMTGFVSVTVVV